MPSQPSTYDSTDTTMVITVIPLGATWEYTCNSLKATWSCSCDSLKGLHVDRTSFEGVGETVRLELIHVVQRCGRAKDRALVQTEQRRHSR